jgi:hypothetical protein
LEYNLHHKPGNWIETLATEAETAMWQVHISVQNYYGHAVAKKLNNIIKVKTQKTIGLYMNGI